MECISELRGKGFNVPLYPEEPSTPEEEVRPYTTRLASNTNRITLFYSSLQSIKVKYGTVLGSAVNPVLREGNSDRRVAAPVKRYAMKNPHKMGIWSKASRTHVAHMTKGDFYASETSATMRDDTDVRIEFVTESGEVKVMKESTPLLKGEVIDSSFMSKKALCEFFEEEITNAKNEEILLSLHLKATMMKVSDPIMFGHCVKTFYKDAFEKHGDLFDEIGANPNNGIGDIYDKVYAKCNAKTAVEVIHDVEACYDNRPWLAMVNSHKVRRS